MTGMIVIPVITVGELNQKMTVMTITVHMAMAGKVLVMIAQ